MLGWDMEEQQLDGATGDHSAPDLVPNIQGIVAAILL